MKIKKSYRNGVLIVFACLLSALIGIASMEIILSSIVKVNINGETIEETVNYLERSRVAFEDSTFFNRSLRNGVQDITRLAVIRNQMETNGQYDGKKKIDITAFANRNKQMEVSEPSVYYNLDDLIKWGNYGYDYQTVTGTNAQLDTYFYALQSGDKKLTASDAEIVHADSIDGQDIGDVVEDNMSVAQEYEASQEDESATMYILVDRYKTSDGKTLISKASSRADYEQLVKNLCNSAEALFSNYTEYTDLVSKYSEGKTNLLYCYQLVDNDGVSRRYTNLPQNVMAMSNDDLSKIFTGHNKYICFNPDKLQLATNSKGVSPEFMKSAMDGYEYSFRDGSRVWLAVDETYSASDVFVEAKRVYEQDDPLFIPSCIVIVASVIILLIIIVRLTIQAGKVTLVDEEGNKSVSIQPGKSDGMAFEIYLIIVGAAFLLIGCLLAMTDEIFMSQQLYLGDHYLIYTIIGTEAALSAAILLPLYLIFVRKIKCHLIWKGSLLRWICVKIRDGAIDLYDNGQLITRTWLPFLLFLALNLVLVLLGVGGILIAFCFDMIIGIWLYKETKTRETIVDGITTISDGDLKHKINTKSMHGDNLALANAVNNIGDGIDKAVDASMRNEKMKADLITNVSHDIKTPLTSIINYVDLLKRENIQDERIRGYIDVLDQKSQRLKSLTNDLVEASKISSGNISLSIEKINLVELINQSVGEFIDKFEEKGLTPILDLPGEPVFVMADSRGIYRVVENLYNNIYKYALENTRVYVSMDIIDNAAVLSFKNISAEPLNVNSNDLTERFTRGDVSRKTEGSGLGLSIAKSLTEAMNGSFAVTLDGDLFKAIISFDVA